MNRLKPFFVSVFLLGITALSADQPLDISCQMQWGKIPQDVGYSACFPGDFCGSFLYEGLTVSSSVDQDVIYGITTDKNASYGLSETADALLNGLQERYPDEAVSLIPSTQEGVFYIAEVRFQEGSKIARIYCTENHLYIAVVAGEDLSLASQFFDSIQITQ